MDTLEKIKEFEKQKEEDFRKLEAIKMFVEKCENDINNLSKELAIRDRQIRAIRSDLRLAEDLSVKERLLKTLNLALEMRNDLRKEFYNLENSYEIGCLCEIREVLRA